MELSFIKNVVESNLTSLHGPISNLDFDKISESNNGYNIVGSFRTTFSMGYFEFKMNVDKEGKITDYEKKRKDSGTDRITLS